MYELYKEMCEDKNKPPVKEYTYRKIFNTQFNLSFHKPSSDTCCICDKLQHEIEAGNLQSKVDKEIHLRKAEAARHAKEEAKNLNPLTHIPICFDLQKTLPTPMVTCSKVYYLRQLWTYNFGIHNLCTGEAHMYIWHEAEGSKGSQEVASCILKFLTSVTTVPDKTKINIS